MDSLVERLRGQRTRYDLNDAGDEVVADEVFVNPDGPEAATALESKDALILRMREALEPFATFAADNTDDDGWAGNRCERERIVDWFGPSDFRKAREALSSLEKIAPAQDADSLSSNGVAGDG